MSPHGSSSKAAIGSTKNDGTGHFTDVSKRVLPKNKTVLRGFTPKFVDITGDRYPDLAAHL